MRKRRLWWCVLAALMLPGLAEAQMPYGYYPPPRPMPMPYGMPMNPMQMYAPPPVMMAPPAVIASPMATPARPVPTVIVQEGPAPAKNGIETASHPVSAPVQESSVLPVDYFPGEDAGPPPHNPHPIWDSPHRPFYPPNRSERPWDGPEFLLSDSCTIEIMGGGYFNVSGDNYNFSITNIRFGWVVPCVTLEDTFVRGYFEPMLDINGGFPFDSAFGDYFAGASLLMRYNFTQPHCPAVPYVQIGAGGQYNNAPKNQTVFGEPTNFVFGAQMGARFFVAPLVAFNVEGGYYHVSSLGSTNNNNGINALGASIGLTLLIPSRP